MKRIQEFAKLYYIWFIIVLFMIIIISLVVFQTNRQTLNKHKTDKELDLEKLRAAQTYKEYLYILRSLDSIPNKKDYRKLDTFLKLKEDIME